MKKIKEMIKLKSLLILNINRDLTESDKKSIEVKSQTEHQIQIQETKESCWIFDKTNSMKKKQFIKLVN